MRQRKSLLFASFPADMLVWKLLLRMLLSSVRRCRKIGESPSAPQPVSAYQRRNYLRLSPVTYKSVYCIEMLTIKSWAIIEIQPKPRP